MLTEVVHREDPHAAEEIGRLWIVAPDGSQSYFAPGARYPSVSKKGAADVAAYARSHLMGTRVNFTALDWGRDPSAYEVRNVRKADGGRTTVLELAPRPTPQRRRSPVNAGAMFETTSWAYVHDLYVGRSELTVDDATRRIVREVDYGTKGETHCEVTLSDWRDVGEGRSVPLRVRFQFPGQKFTVDDRFEWRPEGLWTLKEGESRFETSGPQRETLIDLKINAPTPALDAALDRARKAVAALTESARVPAERRSVTTGPFALGTKIPLAGPGPASLAFTLQGNKEPINFRRYDFPALRAVVTRPPDGPTPPPETQLLLVLYDGDGRPVGAATGAGRDAVTLDLGRSRVLGAATSWSLTVLSPGAARPVAPEAARAPLGVGAFPVRPGEDQVVQVEATGDDRLHNPDQKPSGEVTRVRTLRLRDDDRGGLAATIELISQDHWKMLQATVTLVLLDANDVPVAAGVVEQEFKVEQAIFDSPDLAIPLHGLTARGAAARVLVEAQAVTIGAPLGSLWGRFGDSRPQYPVSLLLAGEDPAVWGRGLAALNDPIARAIQRSGPRKPDEVAHSKFRGEVRRSLRPHRDRLLALFPVAADRDPRGLVPLCRLAGYSGDDRMAAPLRRLLDHPREDVRDAAAIGLGLLGDGPAAGRLRAILDRPTPDDPDASSAALELKREASRVLQEIAREP
jgi:hypothetical protein